MYSKKELQTLIKFQAKVRGFLVRKAYQFKQLPDEELEDYKVQIQGNDPSIKGLPKHCANDRVAIIGTSGMRSVELACQLSQGAPKLIIIDNSKQVIDFWRNARDLMSHSDNTNQFLTYLRIYVTSSQCNRARNTEKEFTYLSTIFEQYSFEQIKKIITSAVIIGQSWSDIALIIKLKNILAHNSITTIYTYTSNIASYVSDKAETKNILRNIQLLNPAIAIHTDFIKDRPKNYFLITDHNPEKVKHKLCLQSEENLSFLNNAL